MPNQAPNTKYQAQKSILLLAPHPFFQARGTPIAVDLLLRVLSRHGHRVDVVTYREGAGREYDGVSIYRIPPIPFVRNIRPGFSVKKIICDLFLAAKAARMAKLNKYDLIHAVEESVFIAMRIKNSRGIPYIYDMDSSMPDQVAEKCRLFRPLLPWMKRREKQALLGAEDVAAVCEELAGIARAAGARRVTVLKDVSLLGVYSSGGADAPELESSTERTTFMYIGNLEKYQGIDLLIESFAKARRKDDAMELILAGGTPSDIDKYRRKAGKLGLQDEIRFVGPKPIEHMASLFKAADVLVSPRITGTNTPMKIYSYLDSGKPLLATDLPTHTQVLNGRVAALAPPEPGAFAKEMVNLASDRQRAADLAAAAKSLARSQYSFDHFEQSVLKLFAAGDAGGQ
ncbi:MAG: glycosyltransferase family 4 protein [Kiritimatiellia bacterium]